MVRDVLRGPGIRMAVIGALTVWLAITAGGAVLGAKHAGLVFVFLATAGIVSQDLAGGYYRTLFATPVTPALYYLQRWLVGGVVVTFALVLIDAVIAWRVDAPIAGAELLARAGLVYLLVGGLVLLFSTVTRRDWVFAAIVIFAQSMLDQLRHLPFATPARVAEIGYRILPPFHLVGSSAPIPSGSELAHVVLYGVGLLALAFAVLWYRPLATGMRD